jgi:hypothetical protein
MQHTPPSNTSNMDLEAQNLTNPEATHSQEDRRPSQANSQTASSNSSKSLGRWEEYKPGNFKATCHHKLDPSKCTECGSKKSQKKLFWACSMICTVGIIAMFVVVAVLESDRNHNDSKA